VNGVFHLAVCLFAVYLFRFVYVSSVSYAKRALRREEDK
jgi:hypothetical protein